MKAASQETVDRFTGRATRLAASLTDLCIPLHLSAAVRRPEVLARLRGQAEAFTEAIDQLEQQLREASK